jgi:hypothetical protein
MNPTNATTTTTTTTQKLLTAVLGLQVLTLLGLWTGQPHAASVQAAIPDPGAQREAMVAEQKATNEKLEKLLALLTSGDVKVKVEDKNAK